MNESLTREIKSLEKTVSQNARTTNDKENTRLIVDQLSSIRDELITAMPKDNTVKNTMDIATLKNHLENILQSVARIPVDQMRNYSKDLESFSLQIQHSLSSIDIGMRENFSTSNKQSLLETRTMLEQATQFLSSRITSISEPLANLSIVNSTSALDADQMRYSNLPQITLPSTPELVQDIKAQQLALPALESVIAARPAASSTSSAYAKTYDPQTFIDGSHVLVPDLNLIRQFEDLAVGNIEPHELNKRMQITNRRLFNYLYNNIVNPNDPSLVEIGIRLAKEAENLFTQYSNLDPVNKTSKSTALVSLISSYRNSIFSQNKNVAENYSSSKGNDDATEEDVANTSNYFEQMPGESMDTADTIQGATSNAPQIYSTSPYATAKSKGHLSVEEEEFMRLMKSQLDHYRRNKEYNGSTARDQIKILESLIMSEFMDLPNNMGEKQPPQYYVKSTGNIQKIYHKRRPSQQNDVIGIKDSTAQKHKVGTKRAESKKDWQKLDLSGTGIKCLGCGEHSSKKLLVHDKDADDVTCLKCFNGNGEISARRYTPQDATFTSIENSDIPAHVEHVNNQAREQYIMEANRDDTRGTGIHDTREHNFEKSCSHLNKTFMRRFGAGHLRFRGSMSGDVEKIAYMIGKMEHSGALSLSTYAKSNLNSLIVRYLQRRNIHRPAHFTHINLHNFGTHADIVREIEQNPAFLYEYLIE
jgi:BMFP domain-containing protein YqiC